MTEKKEKDDRQLQLKKNFQTEELYMSRNSNSELIKEKLMKIKQERENLN